MGEVAGLGTRFTNNNWIPFQNGSGETIPAYAVMRITGMTTINDRSLLAVAKPDATDQKWYAVNGPASVANGGVGDCTMDPGVIVAYDSGSPTVGNEWGATSGDWGISSAGTGFVISGIRASTRGLSIVEAIQITSGSVQDEPAYADMLLLGTQDETDTGGFVTVEFDDTDIADYNTLDADHNNDRFDVSEDMVLLASIYMQAVATSGGSSSWATLATVDMKVVATVGAGSGETAIGSFSVCGNSTDKSITTFTHDHFFWYGDTTQIQFELQVTGEDVDFSNTYARVQKVRALPIP